MVRKNNASHVNFNSNENGMNRREPKSRLVNDGIGAANDESIYTRRTAA